MSDAFFAALALDPDAAEPPFEQLRAAVVDAVADGSLAPGTKLPTVRALAATLGVAPGTVARSYKELEAASLIETRGRNGTFVSAQGDAAERELQRAAAAYADLARSLHVDAVRARGFVDAALR